MDAPEISSPEPAPVCVLILNYVTYPQTIRYVDNLKAQRDVRLSILIVDNCSPNGSFEVLRQRFAGDAAVTVIRSPHNGGYASGNNVGLRFLGDRALDFIVISNNDIFLDDDGLLAAMVTRYRESAGAAFLAPVMYVGGREDRKHSAWRLPRFHDDVLASLRILYWSAGRLGLTNRYEFAPGDRRTHPVDCLSGSFFLGAKSVFDRLGGFDEHTFLYGEESILGQKIRRLGLTNYLMRSRRFHHQQGKTARTLHSLFTLQRHWLDSTIYYQQTFNGVGRLGKGILYVLFFCWMVETVLLENFRRFKTWIPWKHS